MLLRPLLPFPPLQLAVQICRLNHKWPGSALALPPARSPYRQGRSCAKNSNPCASKAQRDLTPFALTIYMREPYTKGHGDGMKAIDVFRKHKGEMVRLWADSVFDTYPFETTGFLRTKDDPFGNPVAHMTKEAAGGLV